MKKINKKTIFSVLLVAIIAIAGGAGTYAYFTATRTTESNKFVAGTLDLSVDSNNNVLEPFVIENMGENGNIGGEKTWNVKNTGSLPGRLLVRVQNLNNQENGCNDQEAAIEPNCGQDTEGELGNVINLNLALNGKDVASGLLNTANYTNIGSGWATITPVIIKPGEQVTVRAHWAADENSYGNEIQSDSVQFDTNFRLIQQINGPAPSNT